MISNESFSLCFRKANILSENQYKKYNSTPTIFKVFIHMMTNIQKDNSVYVPQKKLAEKYGINQAQISRALKSLHDLGIIVKGRKRSYYRFDPEIAIATSRDQQAALIAKFKEEIKRYREENEMLKEYKRRSDKIEAKLDQVLDNQEAIKTQIAEILGNKDLSQKQKDERILKLVK